MLPAPMDQQAQVPATPLLRTSQTTLRVRYSETDRMGTFYNSRALEWFECARTEWLRDSGIGYAEMESRGVLLPLVESHVLYHGRASYDDLLKLTCTATLAGKVRVRFDVAIVNAQTGASVASGYTVHAIVGPDGRPIRPPAWFVEFMTSQTASAGQQTGAK